MNREPADADLCAFTSSRQFAAGYHVGLDDGVVIGLNLADAEHQAKVEAHDQEMRRLAVALRQAPTHVELVRRRYPDDGEPATELRRRAGVHARRIWAGWPGGDTA